MNDDLANRNFYTLPKNMSTAAPLNSTATPDELCKLIRENEIGRNHLFLSAFGKRSLTYCDHTASGRPLEFIESFITQHVLPMYANTHTTSSITGLQSTLFRHEAKQIIRNALRASENDAVIFCGSGATGGIQLLISAMLLKTPPIVFVGPYEHHSAELPWINAKAHVIRVQEREDGQPDYDQLERAVHEWAKTGLPLVGCFSAASNVTGVLTDTILVSQIIHKYSGIALFDYATAAAYVKIDMHPPEPNSHKDGVFFSPHKFPGGVNTPGIVVAAKKLFKNKVPYGGGGGGTIFWVSAHSHRFLAEPEEREEPGTPDLVGSVRCGMIVQLKESVGSEYLEKRELEIAKNAISRLEKIENLELLLKHTKRRLPIFSFLIRVPDTKIFLHHNFIASILNDVFGIQVRGGCVCAGPYAQLLLGMDKDLTNRFEQILIEDSRLDRIHLRRNHESSQFEILRPGFVRFSLPYFFSDQKIDEILQAIEWTATHAWKLLPHYVFDCQTGEWKNSKNLSYQDRRWLGDIRFTAEGVDVKELNIEPKHGIVCESLAAALKEAHKIPRNLKVHMHCADQSSGFPGEAHELRWFLLPSEAADLFRKRITFDQIKESPFFIRQEVNIADKNEIKIDDRVVTQLQMNSTDNDVKFPNLAKGSVSNNATNDRAGNSQTLDVPIDKKFPEKSATKRDNAIDDVCSDNSCFLPRPSKVRKIKNGDGLDKDVTEKRKMVHPPKQLMRKVGDAIEEFGMINDGDKVLVGLSGGKDSLTLLHSLLQYKIFAKFKRNITFTVGALTVDPQVASYDPSSLVPYMDELGVEYIYEEVPIFANAQKLSDLRSICSYCSRMKRGVMYSAMRREGWNVLALGQHLDDCAESFLMSAFHNSQLATMKASYLNKEEDLKIIRPLVFVRETETRKFAESNKLPIIPENCPACFSQPKERNRMKQLLAQQEILHPNIFHSLRKAMTPLLKMQISEHMNNGERAEKMRGKRERKSQRLKEAERAKADSKD